MTSKTRKHIWPVVLMSLAVFGLLAAAVAWYALPTQTAQAHGCDEGTAQAQATCITEHVMDGLDHTDDTHSHGPPPVTEPMPGDMIVSSSTTGGAGVKLTLTIESPGDLEAGSSVVLYLEDDFQVPDDIDPRDVYFVGTGTGRVYVVDEIEIEDDDHFDGDDDWDIQVFLPDRRPDNDEGYNNWDAMYSADLELIFTKAAGIKNPTEQGSHSAHYAVLEPGASVPTLDNPGADARNLDDLPTWAKISLSDEDNGRGAEITVTGTGFNNGTGAEVFVLVSDTEPASCEALVADTDKDSLGTAEVGSDDKFVVTFTVHQDEFKPGAVNHICAVDSEAGSPRFSSDVDTFTLEASATVDPATASYGEEITIKARDFAYDVSEINFGTSHKWLRSEMDDCGTGSSDMYRPGEMRDPPTDTSIIVCVNEIDGKDFIFNVPGDLGESTQIAVKDGDQTKRIYLGVVPSSLELSQTEVAPNQSIIISGSGFTEDARIYTDMITIDGVAIDVSDAGTQTDDGRKYVQVTSNGEFTATVRIWTADASDSNPALDDDEYTIKAVDTHAFEGETTVTIKEPTIEVSPATASPRDFIVISGMNWPISTADDDNYVTIEVDGRTRNADVDGNGRFRYEYQLRSTISIGDEHDVTVTYDGGAGGDIEEDTTFETVEAELGLDPGAAAPGQTITVSVEGMPPYSLVEHVKIDGANRLGGRNINTNREGDATVTDILIPFLDPGFYPVEVKVGNETRVAQLEVLAEATVTGVAAELPAAVSDLGDNLDAIFHFNNQSKEWTFYDPRPEFSDLNTLTELHGGQPYWVLVKDSQEDVDWNGRLVSFTCAGGDCWNLEIW
ncbi:MAG: hypothetical protein OXE87_14720 [Chloroflexi bacterium]|nr:hypothetical protein [Chloroflexota bacterium]